MVLYFCQEAKHTENTSIAKARENTECICVKLYCAFGWKLSPFSAEGGLEIIANISTSCTAFSLLLVPLIKSSQKIQQRRTQ